MRIELKVLRFTVATALAFLQLLPMGVSNTLAIDDQGRFYALGVGMRKCSDFVKFREGRIENFTPRDYEIAGQVVKHWVAGYLTAHNYYVADTYNVKGEASVDHIMEWLYEFCRSDQDEYFAESMVALAESLHDKRVRIGSTAEAQQDGPSGTVSLTSKAIAVGIGVSWGNGKLKYHGKEYNISVKGLSLMDLGISSASVAGNVYNLKRVSDIAGTYVAAQAGIALAGGGGGVTMQNQNDVLINLKGTKMGVALTLGPAGITITLKE